MDMFTLVWWGPLQNRADHNRRTQWSPPQGRLPPFQATTSLSSLSPHFFPTFPPCSQNPILLSPSLPQRQFSVSPDFYKEKKMTLVFGNFCFYMGQAGYWTIYNLNWGQWKGRKHKHQWKYFNHLPWHTYKMLATQKCRNSPFLL